MPPSPIGHRRSIAASPAQVWQLISAPGCLEECHPFVAANPVDRWPGPDARDRIEYHNGRRVTRDFTAWEEGSGYDIDISDDNGPVAGVTWRLEPDGGGSALTIAITPRMRVPAAVRWAVVRPMMARYLRSVLMGIEHRVTTGTPVTRNQFGSHRWFSR